MRAKSGVLDAVLSKIWDAHPTLISYDTTHCCCVTLVQTAVVFAVACVRPQRYTVPGSRVVCLLFNSTAHPSWSSLSAAASSLIAASFLSCDANSFSPRCSMPAVPGSLYASPMSCQAQAASRVGGREFRRLILAAWAVEMRCRF